MIGKQILNYKVVSLIGAGGMGNVYLAEHIQFGRNVAIKSLHERFVNNTNLRARFKNEASTMAKLQHPNIVHLYDFLEEENALYLIMEYVEGVPLDDHLNINGRSLEFEQSKNFISQLLDGMGYAHELGVVHRDMKPSNVLVTKNRQLKILDFGIAKMLDDDKSMTKTGTQMGTVYYMSPEQVQGRKVDARTDIYSLGVTFFELLTGRNPYYDKTTEFEVYNHIVNDPLQKVSVIRPEIPLWVDAVIEKATAKNPEERFANCLEFKNAIITNQVGPKVVSTNSVVSGPKLNDLINNPPKDSKKKRKYLKYGLIGFGVIGIIVTVFLLTRPDPVELGNQIGEQYCDCINSNLENDMASFEIIEVQEKCENQIEVDYTEAKRWFEGNDEKTRLFNDAYSDKTRTKNEILTKKIDGALLTQLDGGMWVKQDESGYEDYLWYFSNDTMYMANRKGEFLFTIKDKTIQFDEPYFSGEISFNSLDEFQVTSTSENESAIYRRATSSDSIIGRWTKKESGYNYNYWSGGYDYGATTYSVKIYPDGHLEDQSTKYKYTYVDGNMIWNYPSSGKLYNDFGIWKLVNLGKLKVQNAAVSSLYRSKAKKLDDLSVFFTQASSLPN